MDTYIYRTTPLNNTYRMSIKAKCKISGAIAERLKSGIYSNLSKSVIL